MFSCTPTGACGRWTGACKSDEEQPLLGVIEPVSALTIFPSLALVLVGAASQAPPQPCCSLATLPCGLYKNRNITTVSAELVEGMCPAKHVVYLSGLRLYLFMAQEAKQAG